MRLRSFWNKLRYVKGADIVSVFRLVAAIPYAIFLRRKRPHIWLICELRMEARDNGYWIYRYICEQHPLTDAVYAIDLGSPDYSKLARLHGEIIEWGSIKHWAYYLAAEYNISSQKSGKPDAAVCYALEVSGIWKNKRIFLQHGVIHNDNEFLHFRNTRMRLFVCGAKPEYVYVSRHFGYPEGYVKYLGLARFDGLYNWESERIILVMPTWRKSIANPAVFEKRMDSDDEFIRTRYYKAWQQFFEDPELDSFLRANDMKLLFYPHHDMQRFLHLFHTDSERIMMADWRKCDVQDLLRRSMFLITDYSSVAMDFAYMYKPLLYYQFDADVFFNHQYKHGYFDYRRDGFGPVCETYRDVKHELLKYAGQDFKNDEEYIMKERAFFALHDQNNCERNYQAIKALDNCGKSSNMST